MRILCILQLLLNATIFICFCPIDILITSERLILRLLWARLMADAGVSEAMTAREWGSRNTDNEQLISALKVLTENRPQLDFDELYNILSSCVDWRAQLEFIWSRTEPQANEGLVDVLSVDDPDSVKKDVPHSTVELVGGDGAENVFREKTVSPEGSKDGGGIMETAGPSCVAIREPGVKLGPSNLRKRKASEELDEEEEMELELGHQLLRLPFITQEMIDPLTIQERQAVITACQVVPAVDPSYVINLTATEKLNTAEGLVEALFTHKFPTRKERNREEQMENRRKAYLDPDGFDIEDFLRAYPDPEGFFCNGDRELSASYKKHASAFLSHRFKRYRLDFIDRVLEMNGWSLLQTYRLLMKQKEEKARKKHRTVKFNFPQYRPLNDDGLFASYPSEIDDVFFREAQYCIFEGRINDWITEKKAEREEMLKIAAEAGILQECLICCADGLLEEDMVKCDRELHEYCSNCVKTHAITQLGEGASSVRCMDDTCKDGQYSLSALKLLLPAHSFQLLARRSQQEELRAANLGNIESCPFCEYAMIIDNPDERIFRCLNPQCQKESCRGCHEEAHCPLRCDEVEKDFETKRRKFIEECMTEAVVRKCPKCANRITKEFGCNKMVCPCGCFFCYLCNKELSRENPYAHFAKSSCSQDTPLEQLHEMAAKRAGEEALKKFNTENPNFSSGKVPNIDELAGIRPTSHRRVCRRRRRQNNELLLGDGLLVGPGHMNGLLERRFERFRQDAEQIRNVLDGMK